MKHPLPATCYVLLLTDCGLPKRPTTFGKIGTGDMQITVRFRIVRVSQISASRAIELERERLLPFVPLMSGERKGLIAAVRNLRKVKLERKRHELGLHFSVLGGLRYNPEGLLDLIGKQAMTPLEVLKQSPTYDFPINEGKDRWIEEGQQRFASEPLRLMIRKRFPKLNVSQKIKRIHNPAVLQQLMLEINEVPDAVALRKRLDKAIQSQEP
ncbi:MAG TPA: hypothetical protein PLD20_15365 [Blastocatellia bacterium]|nr:hypothetical protein [Blastocatellia bacterium]HMX25627.1 hypothetical protein [Blastocatellia bacterium]HMY72755.1 hypothetical protein [Blastocatellia bacterium]HMZ19314.1 hypothetical protein [Blastocatellia bacterium]HNG30507.1 hypothetical protein [Blastocatellia bacterium]